MVELLYRFSQFSTIQVFKPNKKHAIRSLSSYLVARNVQPDSSMAHLAIDRWKMAWSRAIFSGEGATSDTVLADHGHMKRVLDQISSERVELGQPIWEIQVEALSKMDFTKRDNNTHMGRKYVQIQFGSVPSECVRDQENIAELVSLGYDISRLLNVEALVGAEGRHGGVHGWA